MYKVDLHTHTTASDGQYTPTELVSKAKDCGIDVLAVTDHDTTDGVEEALAAGKAAGLTVFPGLELGAKEERNLHILGYGFDPANSELRRLCEKLRAGRDERKYRIIDFLREKDVEIPLAEVEEMAGGEVIARPHFAQVMLKHGYVSTMREAFDRYLDTDEYQRIERFKADAETCIAGIRQAGGRAVLAHPYQLRFPDDRLQALIAQLKDFGLDGLECYYPKHTPQQVIQYLELARHFHLHVTAGSDFHGERVKPDVVLVPTQLDLSWLIAGCEG